MIHPLFTKFTRADSFYFVYCLIHIPITILIDSGLAIPKRFQPYIQQSIIEFHISNNNDFLLRSPPAWLVFFGWIEVTLQLPLFFIAAYALYKRSPSIYPYLFLYGIEASMTTLCCLLNILTEGQANGLSTGEISNLFGVYLPTFLIPWYMAYDTFQRDWSPNSLDAKKLK